MHWIGPHSLPMINGVVDRCLINPHGDIDSLLLAAGTEVPPHGRERGALLRPVAIPAACGLGIAVDGWEIVDASDIGATLDSLQPVGPTPPKDCKSRKHGKPHGGKGHEAP